MGDYSACPLASQAECRPWLGKVCAEAASVALPPGISTSCVRVTPHPALWRASCLRAGLKISPVGWSLDFGQGRHGHGGHKGRVPPGLSLQWGQSQAPSGSALLGRVRFSLLSGA